MTEFELSGDTAELLLNAALEESEYGMPVDDPTGETLIPVPVDAGKLQFVNGTVMVL